MSASLDIADTGSRREVVSAAVRDAFESVLGAENPGEDDDFFELGGDSLTALALFLHIEDATGQTLPITAIYDAPTVGKLTERLLCGGTSNRVTCLRELRPAKARNPGPPLFLLHGLGGSVMILRDLAKRIGGPRGVWGIEAPGMDGLSAPLDSVEALAAAHIEDIRSVAPHGPYLFAGYSFGGLIAYEMARQLVADGETVAMLALLDTFPHPGTWKFSSRVRAVRLQAGVYLSLKLWRDLAKRHFAKLQSRSPLAALRHFARGAVRAVTVPTDIMRTAWVHDFAGRESVHKDMLKAVDAAGGATASSHDAIEAVTAAARRAFQNYRPLPYQGRVHVLWATGQQSVPFEPRAIWGHLVKELVVMTAETDHQTLVRGEASGTAAQLTAAIDSALAGTASQEERG